MFKKHDEVRVVGGCRELVGQVGRVTEVSDSGMCTVNFFKAVNDTNGYNVLHRGGNAANAPTFYYFSQKDLEQRYKDFIQVIITYVEHGNTFATAVTYNEYDSLCVEDAIGNALLESGLDRNPELVLSVTAMKIIQED